MQPTISRRLPLFVVDFTILKEYRENLHTVDHPTKKFTLHAINKTFGKSKYFVCIPSTHYTQIDSLAKTQGQRLELQTFFSFCYIFPETTTIFEHAPAITADLCSSTFSDRDIFVVTKDPKTIEKCNALHYTVITLEEAINIFLSI